MKPGSVRSARGVLTGNVFAGLLILGFFILMAIFGPLVSPYDPSATSNATLQPPSWSHLLGTTQTGQDVFSQVLVGSRTSLVIAFLAAIAATFLAVLIGTAAGFMGGLADEGLSAISNVFLVVPALPLAIVLAGYLPNGGELPLALVIAITGWAWGARSDPRPGPFAAQARLYCGRPRQRRNRLAARAGRYVPGAIARYCGPVPDNGNFRYTYGGRSGVPGPRRYRHVELGQHSLLGHRGHRVEPGRVVVVSSPPGSASPSSG